MASLTAKKGTITCFLCGGTHIYPGPRFSTHLMQEHGVIFHLDFIIQASQYKDSNSSLPPVTPNLLNPNSTESSQTEDLTLCPPAMCTGCLQPLDDFLTSTPVRHNRLQNTSQSISINLTPDMSISVLDKSVQNQQKTHPLVPCSSRPDQGLPEGASEVFNSAIGDLPVRSGFRCECALCDYVTNVATTFWSHITKKHQLNYKEYKKEHGHCQVPVGSGKVQCLVCQTMLKHMPGIIDQHLRTRHGLNWSQYLDWVKKERMRSAVKTEVDDEAGDKTVQDVQLLKLPEVTIKKSRPLNVRDKTNKSCSQCKITFPSRMLFLNHCQQVHKLRFKSKSGGSLQFNQSGPSSTQALDKSTKLLSSTKMKRGEGTLPCQFCGKMLSSVGNMDRHVRLDCKGATSDGLEVNEDPGEKPMKRVEEEKGFRCNKCGRLYSKLGNLNRHYIYTCCSPPGQ
eukprot:GFUD01042281.1.p1 GENE.GFUD01042281.1~~GFUD01042281.1.p1  ORF type:complete len:452 (-),score=113.57 GFUD01042281.1:105-1460(-)